MPTLTRRPFTCTQVADTSGKRRGLEKAAILTEVGAQIVRTEVESQRHGHFAG